MGANHKQLKYAITKQFELIEKYEKRLGEDESVFFADIISETDEMMAKLGIKSESSTDYMRGKLIEVINSFNASYRGNKV